MRLPLLCLAALLTPHFLAPLPAQDMVGVSWSGTVYSLDSTTGTGVAIGSAGSGANAMAVDPNGRILYGRRIGSTTYQWELREYDLATNSSVLIGAPGSVDYRGLAFDPAGTLYAIGDGSPDTLYVVDPATAATTSIGGTGHSSIQGLGFANGTLYAWDLVAGLLILDTSSGAATAVNPPANRTSFQFLATRADGTLFVGRDELYTVDTSNGTWTLVGSGGYTDLRGCDFIGPACNIPYGSGCPGSGGFVPELKAPACAQSGGSATLVIDKGLGGSPVGMFFGSARISIPLGNGCELLITPILPITISGTLTGSGPGNGTLSLTTPVPMGLHGASATVQVLLLDTGVPSLFTMTNGLEVIVQ